MLCAPRSERGVSTRFHHRPVSRAGLEPAKLRLSTAGVYRAQRAPRHLDILVRAIGLEPTKPLWATGTRALASITAGQFSHSLTRAYKHKLSKNLAESRGLELRCAEATESEQDSGLPIAHAVRKS